MKPLSIFLSTLLVTIFSATLSHAVDSPAKAAVTRTVRVGIYEAGALAYSDKDGSAHGFFVDMLNHIAKKEQWDVQYVPGSWQEGLDRLKTDNIDLVLCIGYTEERESYMDFPKEYLLLNWGVLYKAKGSKITSLLELEGKSVSALKGDVYLTGFRDLVRQFNVNVKVEEVDQYSKVFIAVESGAVTAGVAGNLYGILNENGRRAEQTPVIFAPIKVGYATNEGKNGDLIAALDRNIAEMKADKASIYHHTLEHLLGKKETMIPKEVYWGMFGIAAALLHVIIWNVMLKRQVKTKTEHLETEITERKRAEDELWNEKAFLRSLIDSATDLIYFKDQKSIYLGCNKASEAFTGHTEQEQIGKSDYDFFDKEMAEQIVKNDQKVLEGGVAVHSYGWVTSATAGRLLLDTVKTPIYGLDGQPIGLVGISRDITERKQAEEEKTKLEGQLLQAQKMESVGRLAGGVAHDFNNMLGVIIGYAELALMKLEPSQPIYANLNEIRTAAERSADLTRQLLAFARKQTIAPKVIDLNETVSGMLKMLQRLIGEDMHLTWQPAPGLWPVKMDPSQIDQMLANLCVNSRDAITDVGRITIETGNRSVDASYSSSQSYVDPGEYVQLVVSDDGCGMDKETAAHIFEPFFTTKGVGEGTGLGLATVYGIVKQNNGFINVYSEPGHGTAFTIYLPRHTGESGEALKESAVEPAARGSETLLLVEDEPTILKMTALMLEGQGYAVLTAGSAGEAIRLFRENPGMIQMLMTDVVMPDMNGRDLLKELNAFNPEVKCLFMSGYTANVIAHHGVLDEGVHFIQKPFSLPDLANKVRMVLDGATEYVRIGYF
jgi:PAS domain S-box-containing protein